MRIAIFCTLMAAVTTAAAVMAPLYKASDSNRIEGSYLVVFKDSVDVKAATEDLKTHLLARFIPMGVIRREYQRVLKGIGGSFSKEAIEVIRRLPQVKFVEEAQIRKTMGADPVASWGLDRIDDRTLTSCDGYYLPHYDGSGVRVYVIDTGVWTTHFDLDGRAFHGYDFVDDDYDATDCNGHGTHCSGTVAGTVFGVAKNAIIIGVRVLGCFGFGSSLDVLAGMEFALVDSGGDKTVVSMSLGGGPSEADDLAVKNLFENDVFVSVAAGNDDGDACEGSPARAPYAMTVGATDSEDEIAYFSNWGVCVNIFAPGVAITSAWYGSDDNVNTISGTSMACPHVSGAAALLRQQDPDADVGTLYATLLLNSTPDCIYNLDPYSVNCLLHVHKLNEV